MDLTGTRCPAALGQATSAGTLAQAIQATTAPDCGVFFPAVAFQNLL